MKIRIEPLAVALVVLALGCQSGPAPSGRLDEAETEGDLFGEALDDGVAMTDLAALVADPEAHRDEVVRTEGEVARVCQRAGCWMELRDGEDGPAVRIPMAGHSFFLPLDSAGRHATIQGRVAIQALSADVREHLESEGAVETTSTLAIHASGVVLD